MRGDRASMRVWVHFRRSVAPPHHHNRVLTLSLSVVMCTQDATDAFTAFHFSSEKANKMLEALPTVKDGSIAATIAEDGASPLVADFRVLVQKWKDQG